MKKKSIVKAVKSTAASVKSTAAAVKKAAAQVVKKPAAPAKAAVAVKKPAAAKAPASKAPAAKAPSAKSRPTAVTALVDVGFGNALFIRGEGAGLSWEKGLPLENAGAGEWTVSLPANGKQVVYKLLINDVAWCTGEDFTVEAGSAVTVTPSF